MYTEREAALIICPFCNHVDRDSWEWNDGKEGDGETECGECGKTFMVSRNVHVSYTTRVPNGP